MFLNENEEKIINKFSENVEIYENKEMILFWDDKNFIKANFDTCFEDENDYDCSNEIFMQPIGEVKLDDLEKVMADFAQEVFKSFYIKED